MRPFPLATAPLALAACSQPAPPAPPPAQAQTETKGGDGSQIVLNPLSARNIEEVRLSGELSCAFATGAGERLLFASGAVASNEPAIGVVKVADYVERIFAPRGFDGMVQGATFSGQGKTIVIAITDRNPVGAGESPPHRATLTYQRADGASRTFGGLWTCGP